MTGLGTLEPLARAGFLVKGVLYLVIGTLAIQVAARAGGRVTGTRGALLTVLGQPFGRMLLLAAAIGLFGYAAWRIVQGVLDPERYGRGWTGHRDAHRLRRARRDARRARLAGAAPASRAVRVDGRRRADRRARSCSPGRTASGCWSSPGSA